MKTIIHTFHVETPPESVCRALTTEQGVTGWWTTSASVEEREGGILRFTFHGDFHPHMKQIQLDPPRLVRWQCVDGHGNWQDNTFSFALRPQDDDTSVQFVQQYAQELDDDTYGTYNFNWGYYLNSLKRFCETGSGTPFQAD